MDDVIEAIADEAEPWKEDAAEAMDDWTRVMLAVEEAVVSSVEDEEEPGLMVTPAAAQYCSAKLMALAKSVGSVQPVSIQLVYCVIRSLD